MVGRWEGRLELLEDGVGHLLVVAVEDLGRRRLRGHGRAELAMWAVVIVYVLLTIRWSGYTVGVMALGTATATA